MRAHSALRWKTATDVVVTVTAVTAVTAVSMMSEWDWGGWRRPRGAFNFASDPHLHASVVVVVVVVVAVLWVVVAVGIESEVARGECGECRRLGGGADRSTSTLRPLRPLLPLLPLRPPTFRTLAVTATPPQSPPLSEVPRGAASVSEGKAAEAVKGV